jgi:hypothetical protein
MSNVVQFPARATPAPDAIRRALLQSSVRHEESARAWAESAVALEAEGYHADAAKARTREAEEREKATNFRGAYRSMLPSQAKPSEAV